MLSRKYASGSNKRKRIDEVISTSSSSLKGIDVIGNIEEVDALNEVVGVIENENDVLNEKIDFLNIFDPRTWDNIDNKIRDILIEKGPLREYNLKFPMDELGRHFADSYYTRKLLNGENQDRKWLVYSKDANKVYCFCCKLFKTLQSESLLANEGLNDWEHINDKLKKHENDIEHIKNMRTWIDLHIRLKNNQTIDKDSQVCIKKEEEHWKLVLVRIIAVVKCLATHNLTFRGDNEKIYQNNNDIFMGLLELIAEFDMAMQEHLRRIKNKEIHYKIQSELISILASKVKNDIIKKIKEAKYYSMILDCTFDASDNEQMTLVIRCVDISCSQLMVKEYFIEFLGVDDTSELALFSEIQAVLQSLELDVDNMRGQGYDNGSNIKGKHQGVQKRFLEINPRVFYMPCACHSLNLTICDMASSCVKAVSFFGVVQRLYSLFVGSTERWKILKDHVHQLTLKSLSITRWESHVDSVAAIITQPNEIRDALFELARLSDDAKTRSEAESLANNELENFEFLLGMTIWHDILNKINLISKKLQSKDMQIDVTITVLKDLISYFEKYRKEGFQVALTLTKELASKMEIDPIFPTKRRIHRKKQFDESFHEEIPLSAEESFRINYFIVVVDIAISSLKTRLEQLVAFEDIFGFLFNYRMLSSLDENTLHKCCVKLQDALKHNDKYDIDARDLFSELQVLQMCLPSEMKSINEVLEFVKSSDCFPNVSVAYRILLTIPVTVASSNKSFSKLKLIKSYLRSTMSEERLNGLAILCIENEVLEKLDLDDIIEDFASQNARRSKLFQ